MKIRLFDGEDAVELEIEKGADRISITIGERRLEIAPLGASGSAGAAVIDGRPVRYLAERSGSSVRVAVGGEAYEFELADGSSRQGVAHGTRNPETRSPMPGKVLQVFVKPGAKVDAGDPLLILEAMKMENVLSAEIGGEIAAVHVAPGDMVEPGKVLVVIRE